MTLTEFLLARVAEDETMARAAMTVHREQVKYLGDGKWGDKYLEPIPATEVVRSVTAYIAPGPSSPGYTWTDGPGSQHFAHHNPARVLAECEAARGLVEDFEILHRDYRVTHDPTTEARRFQARIAVARTAAVYSDHPDYRDEWKP